jgi:DNA-binding MarR family transcriptional regulator
MLLHHLKDFGAEAPCGVRISDLSEHMRVTPSFVTQLVTEMESEGLVARRMDPSDRRSVLVGLTDRGTRAARNAERRLDSVFRGLAERLGQEKSILLSQALCEMTDYLSEAMERGMLDSADLLQPEEQGVD